MAKKEKIKIEKKKKRIPVPKKPPKVEEDKTAYDRKKEKEKLREEIKKHSKRKISDLKEKFLPPGITISACSHA